MPYYALYTVKCGQNRESVSGSVFSLKHRCEPHLVARVPSHILVMQKDSAAFEGNLIGQAFRTNVGDLRTKTRDI